MAWLSTYSTIITQLVAEQISHKAIKVYLSAVQYMHVSAGMFSQFSQQLTPCLQLRNSERNAMLPPERNAILPGNLSPHSTAPAN